MGTLSRAAAVRRELPASWHIPYAAHLAPEVIVTRAGDYVQTLRLAGASFESADDETLNNYHERLNVTWRNIASPNVALWVHLIRRREVPRAVPVQGTAFADRLARRYQERLAGETLMVNEVYLTLLFRPVTGVAPSVVSRLVSGHQAGSGERERTSALESCAKLRETVLASLARYEPEVLGVYLHGGRRYSSLLEFFALLVNGESQRVPLPRAPIANLLATTRLLFGSEVIEYRLPTCTRFGAVLGIKEYPTPTVVGMLNGLLSAPFPFVLTQSFTFLTKATGQGLSAFFTLVGTHGLHVSVGLIWLIVMLLQVKTLGFRPMVTRRFYCFGLFWHALDIVWIGVFTIVYLGANSGHAG